MHPRLKQQLESHFGDGDIPEDLAPFMESVERAYEETDRERLDSSRGTEPPASRAEVTNAPPATRMDQILLLDENGTIVECKGGGPGELCFRPEASIGKKFMDVPLVEGAERAMQAIERCRISAAVESAEFRATCSAGIQIYDGRFFTARHAQVVAIIQLRGKAAGLAARPVPQAQFLRRILDHSPGFIFVKDRDGRFTAANRSVAAAYGTIPTELVGKTDADFNPDAKEVAAFLEADRKVIDERKEIFIAEESVTAADGATRWVQTIKVPLIEPNGACDQMLGISTDITIRRAAEQKLRKRTDQILRTHAALEELALTVSLNTAEALARISRVTVRALGTDRVGLLLVNEDPSTLTWCFEHNSRGIEGAPEPTWERVRLRKYLAALQAGHMLAVSDIEGDERVDELRESMLRPAGIRSTLDVPIRVQGRLVGVLCSGQTDRVRTWTLEDQDLAACIANFASVTLETARRGDVEEQLRQSQKMEAIGVLAGGVAHDFNNLLTVILGYADMASASLHEGHPTLPDLEQIAAAASRATELTRSLLAFSRKHVLDVAVIDLAASIKEFHGLLARIMGEDLEVVSSGLDQSLYVMGDRSQLDQVMLNLATNARQAMPNGGTLRIHLRHSSISDANARSHGLAHGGHFAQIVVEDTGGGMSAEALARLWEPFFTTKASGTGLGLSVVYGIIESHGGFITAQSRIANGSVFRVYLPLTTSEQLSEIEEPDSSGLHGTETILLAEDEGSLRKLLKTGLGKLGYKVLEAEDGEQAVKLAQRHPDVDALILDVVMPRVGGPEAFDRIRELMPAIPALFISGYAPESSQLGRILRDPGTELISKPFVMRDVSERLRILLDSTRPSQPKTEPDEAVLLIPPAPMTELTPDR